MSALKGFKSKRKIIF